MLWGGRFESHGWGHGGQGSLGEMFTDNVERLQAHYFIRIHVPVIHDMFWI